MLSAPGTTPVLGGPDVPSLPTIVQQPVPAPVQPPVPSAAGTVLDGPSATNAVVPTLPIAAPAPAADQASPSTGVTADPPAGHPMAHLMPEKSAKSEASRRAAETRAAKKA